MYIRKKTAYQRLHKCIGVSAIIRTFDEREGFVLKAKVHSAKLMDQEGIKTLLEHVGEKFPRLFSPVDGRWL